MTYNLKLSISSLSYTSNLVFKVLSSAETSVNLISPYCLSFYSYSYFSFN